MKFWKTMSAVAALAVCGVAGAADVDYGLVKNAPERIETASVIGIRFGLPAAVSSGYVEGLEFSLCWGATRHVDGFRWTLLGATGGDTQEGAELAFVNLLDGKLEGAQIGLVNHSGKGGWQFGLVNCCSDDATFQFGLLNRNRNGLLGWSILVNFGSKVFARGETEAD